LVEPAHHGIKDGLSVQRSDEFQAKFTSDLSEAVGDAGQVLVRDLGNELASLDISLPQAGISMGAAPGLVFAGKLRALRTSRENFRAKAGHHGLPSKTEKPAGAGLHKDLLLFYRVKRNMPPGFLDLPPFGMNGLRRKSGPKP